ncbi:SRPBCC family protein [Devosia sp.]|uniref:SRPBCC family protein n=1 Tax=Devosia sp. TaxID=1871048 RepID=UPI003267F1EC
MTDVRRTDRASRLIKASPPTLYNAFIDPEALLKWLPPKGMSGEFFTFDPRPGGSYRMVLTYTEAGHETSGKTSADADIVDVAFIGMIPNERVVQAVKFQSEDPSFAGTMTMAWVLTPRDGATEVTITCEKVPPGIGKADHDRGLASSLENLARYAEGRT